MHYEHEKYIGIIDHYIMHYYYEYEKYILINDRQAFILRI